MGKSETDIQDRIRLEASKAGCRLWRNNVGALLDSRGVPVRYGLANETSQQNKLVKSADLIGIMPVKIRQEHVGMTFGVFMSIECKREGWSFRPNDKRQQAQARWAEIIRSLNGYAQMCTSWDDVILWR